MEKLELKQRKQKHYFEGQTKALLVLETGDRIRVRMRNSWKLGKNVQHAETPRSYKIQTDEGRKYAWNQRMLIKSPEDKLSSLHSSFASDSPTTSTGHSKHISAGAYSNISPPWGTVLYRWRYWRDNQDCQWYSCSNTMHVLGWRALCKCWQNSFEQLQEFASCWTLLCDSINDVYTVFYPSCFVCNDQRYYL